MFSEYLPAILLASFRQTVAVVAFLFYAFLLVSGITATGYAQSFSLGFPIAGQNPYTAPIISVIDHSATVFYDEKNTQVETYTGELGKDKCGRSGQPCGYYLNPAPFESRKVIAMPESLEFRAISGVPG